MFLLKLILRLWLVGVHLGLWGLSNHNRTATQHAPAHLQPRPTEAAAAAAAALANSAAAAPGIGIAARQGRRFGMEDRAVQDSGGVVGHSSVWPMISCGPANYTYAAGRWCCGDGWCM